jgi:putative ABC transport system permease protein
MNLVLGITEGLREIWAHKFRSLLTMFGITMGVGSLIATFALTAGMAQGARETLQNVGGVERIEINDAPVPAYQENLAGISPGRTYRDALAIAQSVPLVSAISPEIDMPGVKISRGSNSYNPRVIAAQEGLLDLENHVVRYGRYLTELDQRFVHRVCILGRTVVDELWPEGKAVPLGELVRLNGHTFRVVGIFEHYQNEYQKRAERLGLSSQQEARRKTRGSSSPSRRGDPFWFKNRVVVIPLSTMQIVFKSAQVGASGLDSGPDMKLSRLNVKVSDMAQFDVALDQLRNVLNLTHRGIQDFGFQTREDWFENIERQVQGFRLSGGFIAMISLLVGGLGITNIMLASITERIRELGIRRALGARGRDIFAQILIEGIVLACLGGLVGLGVGYGFVQILIMISPSENNPLIEQSSLLISLSAAVLIGLCAAFYPAWKASKLSPIQALRYE